MEHVAIDLDDLPSSASSTTSTTSEDGEAAEELAEESKAYLAQQHHAHQRTSTTDFDKAAEGEMFDLKTYFQDSHTKALQHGGKPKRMGVSAKNLTVVGLAPENSVIATMASPFRFLWNVFNPYWWKSKEPTTEILSDINMFCKDGEMVLVLGRPGSGCSTLLRVLANMQKTFVEVKGEVNYGGIPSSEFSRFRGEAIYTPEEECHNPFLTLRETLDFALKCKTPGNRLPEETRVHFREKMIKLLTTMFGLQKQLDTIVGDDFIRGLSGGERKRLTLMEAMVTSAAITCWDCGTRGLDAASAFDYVQCLRVMTDVLGKTTICSFYQASESIYDLFDRVVVLDKGKLVYFGPTKEAKQYFLDMGFICEARKSTPDFLTGVTNAQERIVRKGFENKVPETSVEFEKVWKNSKNCQKALDDQKQYDEEIETNQPAQEFKEEVRAQKNSKARKGGVYTAAFHTQILALAARELTLRWRDKFGLYSKLFSVLVQALLYGSIFFLMPETTEGLYSRGGGIFSIIVFSTFIMISELPGVFQGRVTLQKHRSYAMYHPSAYHLAQVVADLPLVFVQCFLFSIIAYFMYGLVSDGNNFFIFLFVFILTTNVVIAFYRFLGNIMPSIFIAQELQNIIIATMIMYTGFVIPYSQMKPWFQWFHWVDPLTYGLRGLIINEVADNRYFCNDSAVPFGPEYTDPAYRTCPQGIGKPGQLWIDGNDYLDSIEFTPHLLPLFVFVIIFYWALFTVLNCIAVELLEFTGGGYTKKVYKAGKAPKGTLTDEKEQARIVEAAAEGMSKTLTLRSSTFSWRKLRYTVPVGGEEKKRLLLDNVDGWIQPGQMTALMGASGAGKTTLLDVLARRKTIGKVKGDVLLNGKPLEVDFERITGYVEQSDVFNPMLTVREALRFSAKLRQEPSVPDEEKFEYVENVLAMMEMKHLGDALIGELQSGLGISVEERKRLTIGMELVAKPHILFLDEPTSGLDAQSSYNIVKFIRRLADSGMPLVCTIHQPSPVLFEYFDRILLLAKGGKTVYFGDIGENSKTLLKYFEKNGVRKCTKEENPAEYILEAIGAGVNGKSYTDWSDVWKKSSEYAEVQKKLDEVDTMTPSTSDVDGPPREFATSQLYQCWEVYKRLNTIWWRSPFYNMGRIGNGLYIGLLLGFSYWDFGVSASDLRLRVWILFQTMLLGMLLIFSAMPNFLIQREYFRRDYASKIYSWFPFAVSIVLVEIPYIFCITSTAFLTFYWASGLNVSNPIDTGFYLWLAMTIFTSYCVAFGQCVAALCTHVLQAIVLLPIFIQFLFLFCGVLNPPHSLPDFWHSWMYPLVPTRYYLEGVVTNVLVGVEITCNDADVAHFLPPPNVTCGDYAANFLVNSTGYITNPNATQPELCGYCQYERGEDYYESFIGWDYDYRWRDMGIVLCYWFVAVLTTVLFSYINRKGRR